MVLAAAAATLREAGVERIIGRVVIDGRLGRVVDPRADFLQPQEMIEVLADLDPLVAGAAEINVAAA